MAQPQKFVTLDQGRQKLMDIESVNSSSGVSDAAKLVRTGSNGKLDPTLLPPGSGSDALAVTASEALSAGDFVNIYSGGARKADGSVAGKEAVGYVLDAVSNGQTATVYFEGSNSSLTTLTVGSRYYLSSTIPGGVTATPPSTAGNVVQYLGMATTATSIAFEATDGVILA